MTHATRRIVSVAHSYCVALNRRLADEMARQGDTRWDVTAVSPALFVDYLRPIPMERLPGERCRSEAVPAYFTRRIHLMLYGRRLREILKKPWDVVHCWEEPYLLAAAQVALWKPRPARLIYATCQNIPKAYPPPTSWIERYTMGRADGWIGFGESIRSALADRPPYRSRPGRVIPFGVDLEAFQPDPARRKKVRQELGWDSEDPPVIGFVGRFVPEKGLGMLMRCLADVRPPWRALFVGVGVMEQELRRWGRSHGDRVRVVTEVPHGDIPGFLDAMDLLCAPSRTTPGWREQFGRVLIEAFACGVPVVGSDSGEIPHVVGDAGIVVGEDDAQGWVRELTRLLDDPSHRAELAARGLDRVRARYTWATVARQHLELFEELMDSRQAVTS